MARWQIFALSGFPSLARKESQPGSAQDPRPPNSVASYPIHHLFYPPKPLNALPTRFSFYSGPLARPSPSISTALVGRRSSHFVLNCVLAPIERATNHHHYPPAPIEPQRRYSRRISSFAISSHSRIPLRDRTLRSLIHPIHQIDAFILRPPTENFLANRPRRAAPPPNLKRKS